MGGEFAAWGGVFVAEDDPQSGAIGFVIAGADGTGELGELEARAAQEFGEDAAGVVNEIAKTLGNKNGIYVAGRDRKSTRLNSSHSQISYAVFCLEKKNITE